MCGYFVEDWNGNLFEMQGLRWKVACRFVCSLGLSFLRLSVGQ